MHIKLVASQRAVQRPQSQLRCPSIENLVTSSNRKVVRRRESVRVHGEFQSGNTATLKRTDGPPMEPPLPPDEGGGGGGWWGKWWRNLGANAVLIIILFCVFDDEARIFRLLGELKTKLFGDGGGPLGPTGYGGGGGGDGAQYMAGSMAREDDEFAEFEAEYVRPKRKKKKKKVATESDSDAGVTAE